MIVQSIDPAARLGPAVRVTAGAYELAVMTALRAESARLILFGHAATGYGAREIAGALRGLAAHHGVEHDHLFLRAAAHLEWLSRREVGVFFLAREPAVLLARGLVDACGGWRRSAVASPPLDPLVPYGSEP